MTLGVFGRQSGHEQVIFGQDPESGLKVIVGLYSTALGPGLGGTRFYPFPDEDAALEDVLRLSQGMAYKNALAGLPHGGGKAVIIGDPARDKTPELLAAYGRFIDSLGGRYVTAADVGTCEADMDVIGQQTKYVTGRSIASGGIGDPSPHTAFGVFQGMRAAAMHRWGSDSLAGKRVGVSGVGKVGSGLIEHLVADKASVLVTDVRPDAVEAVRTAHPDVEAVADNADMLHADLDVFAPCALGGVIDDDTARTLNVGIICGGANNQLARPELADVLQERGVLYAPDYLVNAGGVIHVADELHGYDAERVRQRTARIYDTTAEVLALADAEGVAPETAASRIAERRMSGTS